MSHEPNNLPEFRSITDSELDDVCGGISPAFMLAAAVVAYWDLPFGATKESAAAALGVEHLL